MMTSVELEKNVHSIDNLVEGKRFNRPELITLISPTRRYMITVSRTYSDETGAPSITQSYYNLEHTNGTISAIKCTGHEDIPEESHFYSKYDSMLKEAGL